MAKNNIPNSARDASEKYLKGQLSRRNFIKWASAAGISLGSLPGLLNTVKLQDGMESSADVAVRVAAEKYSGETVTLTREAGPQTQDPEFFSGPLWEELTGVKTNIIPLNAGPEQYQAPIQEHIAGSGAFDIIDVQPVWMADYVRAGVLEPLDDFIAEYMVQSDMEDFPPIYRDLGRFEGVNYGIFDDGDTILIYYRKDLFAANSDEFADMYGYPLAPPENWQQHDQIAKFFTEKMAPDVYGSAFGRAPGAFWNVEPFLSHFKTNGGELFNADTMDAMVNGEAGVRTVAEMAHSNRWMPPGITELTVIDTFFEWIAGNYAMTYFWPPLGRWSAGMAEGVEALSFVPESFVKDVTGYALFPGNISQMAAGFSLSVSSDSPNKELAYLYIQWLTSPEISLQRVTLPYSLRDPYRISHFESDLYRGLWADAGDYLDTLMAAGENASLDILMPGGQEYQVSIDRACTAVYAGTDPQEAMDTCANEWNEITERLGVDAQKSAYASYVDLPGAYPASSGSLADAPSNLDVE